MPERSLESPDEQERNTANAPGRIDIRSAPEQRGLTADPEIF
jgi:hypothetical protein